MTEKPPNERMEYFVRTPKIVPPKTSKLGGPALETHGFMATPNIVTPLPVPTVSEIPPTTKEVKATNKDD